MDFSAERVEIMYIILGGHMNNRKPFSFLGYIHQCFHKSLGLELHVQIVRDKMMNQLVH
jgi:hypothetical protein